MTSEQNAGRRGAPLMFLAAVIGGWLVARAATFTPLWTEVETPTPDAPAPSGPGSALAAQAAGGDVVASPRTAVAMAGGKRGGWIAPTRFGRRTRSHVAVLPEVPATSLPPRADDAASMDLVGSADRRALAASPIAVSHPASGAGSGLMLSPPRTASAQRWSADGWLLLREDAGRSVVAGRPSYGRSQAGAVLRYSLDPGSRHLPQAHMRATAALAGIRERELATGLSARLGRHAPVRVALEARVSELGGGPEVRPAAYAVTELPPVPLPFGARGELYLQGGYVGGTFATAFADGQARVDRPVARSGEAELTLGAGVWGGAQKGSERLDVGPTAAASFRLGPMRGRIAADYRFRIAGRAEPSSGPALTVSAGF